MRSIATRPLLFRPAIARNRKPVSVGASCLSLPPLIAEENPQLNQQRPKQEKRKQRKPYHDKPGRNRRSGSKPSSSTGDRKPDRADFVIRKLLPGDLAEVTRHLLALDPRSRRLRFGHGVSDAFLRGYAVAMFESVSLVYGADVEGHLRGVGEIRGETTNWLNGAEVALSVEEPWQNRGIGSALLKRLVLSAKNRSIEQLYMVCLRDNTKMQHIASQHAAYLQYTSDEVEGRITNLHPSFVSLASEFFDEANSYMRSLYRIGTG